MKSEEINDVLLADIGNTYFHIYDGQIVEHLSYEDAIAKYKEKKLYYISVKKHLHTDIKKWIDIEDLLEIEGEYETMGVDRKALCRSHKNGLFIDAGSAITVDIVEDGMYFGGYIFPGIKKMLEGYAEISPVLDVELNREISLERLPKTTKEQISYGIIASIKALIDKHSAGKTLYFTGGDGKLLASFFNEAVYDETLVFQGIMNALHSNEKLKMRNEKLKMRNSNYSLSSRRGEPC